jgi:hypothetical protein
MSNAPASRWRRRLLGACLAAFAALLLAPAARAADRIYWSNFENDTIAWTKLDGSGGGATLNTAGATVDGPMGMTIDPAHGRIYWANWANHTGTTISYANLDGSGGGDLAITGATVAGPHGLAIDPADGPYGTLYWPNHDMTAGSSIAWARLDATGAAGAGGDLPITSATLDEPRGVTIDPLTDRIYWANFADGLGKSISWSALDGSASSDLISDIGANDPEAAGPEGTAIDPATRKIYWSDFGERHLIQFANPDGTGISNLNTAGAATRGVHGVTIDPETDRIYWANWYSDGIAYASLDGSGGDDLDTSGTAISRPDQPAILKEPTATADPAISGGSDPGATLACSTGTWAGDVLEALAYQAPERLAYRWTRDGVELPGADADTVTATEAGAYRCIVTATNAAGSTAATSAAHQVVSPPPPPPPPPPSNHFSFGKVKLNRHHGTAKLAVDLPGPGDVALAGKHLTAVSKHPGKAGEVRLKIKPRGKAKRTLLRRGKLTVRPQVTFTPTGGTARTETKRVKLIEKRAHR